MSESTQSTWLTQDAYDRLTAELARRKDADRKEIAQRVEAARQEGDLRENAGYHAAREEASLNEARIAQLTQMLENAQIGEVVDDGTVAAGTVVTAGGNYGGPDDIGPEFPVPHDSRVRRT